MTTLHEVALKTETLITSLEDENARLKIKNGELQNHIANLEDTYVRLQEASSRALAERDYYMRECAELEGKFTAFVSIATEAINTHRMAPFRPNGAAPKDSPINDIVMKAIEDTLNEPIPAFLAKPQQEWLTDRQKRTGETSPNTILHTKMPEATGPRRK